MNMTCSGCGEDVVDGQTAIELRNGIMDTERGEIPPADLFGSAFLHAGSGEPGAPDCLTPDNIRIALEHAELAIVI